MVKFANNDRSRICCSSLDCNLSICDVTASPPCVISILKGHSKAVSGIPVIRTFNKNFAYGLFCMLQDLIGLLITIS